MSDSQLTICSLKATYLRHNLASQQPKVPTPLSQIATPVRQVYRSRSQASDDNYGMHAFLSRISVVVNLGDVLPLRLATA